MSVIIGTGTQSGLLPEEASSLLQLTAGGKQPITLPNGEQRTFLQDGDVLGLLALSHKAGFRRIGFGVCEGQMLPAGV
jgi:fumarylacetoacetase